MFFTFLLIFIWNTHRKRDKDLPSASWLRTCLQQPIQHQEPRTPSSPPTVTDSTCSLPSSTLARCYTGSRAPRLQARHSNRGRGSPKWLLHDCTKHPAPWHESVWATGKRNRHFHPAPRHKSELSEREISTSVGLEAWQYKPQNLKVAILSAQDKNLKN